MPEIFAVETAGRFDELEELPPQLHPGVKLIAVKLINESAIILAFGSLNNFTLNIIFSSLRSLIISKLTVVLTIIVYPCVLFCSGVLILVEV